MRGTRGSDRLANPRHAQLARQSLRLEERAPQFHRADWPAALGQPRRCFPRERPIAGLEMIEERRETERLRRGFGTARREKTLRQRNADREGWLRMLRRNRELRRLIRTLGRIQRMHPAKD